MKKNIRMFRIVWFLLALLIIAFAAVSCNQSGSENATEESDSTETTVPTDDSSETTAEKKPSAPPYRPGVENNSTEENTTDTQQPSQPTPNPPTTTDAGDELPVDWLPMENWTV